MWREIDFSTRQRHSIKAYNKYFVFRSLKLVWASPDEVQLWIAGHGNDLRTDDRLIVHTLASRHWTRRTIRNTGSLTLEFLAHLCWNSQRGRTLKGAIKFVFRKKLGIWPNKGRGGLTEAQVLVKIFQNQICHGKWPEM